MTSPQIRAVIFDLDQTLLDREQSLQAFLDWQTELLFLDDGIAKTRFVKRFIELDDHGMVWKDKVYQQLVDEFDTQDWTAAELLSMYELCFCAFSVPKAGMTEAVEKLAPHYKLGVISNGMSPFQERNFRGLGFSSYFDNVLVSQAVGLRKPDAAIFHLGCSELGVKPEDAVYVGDNPVADIGGAKAAGLRTVFIPSRQYPECSEADVTCSDMKELPDTIGKI